MQHDDEWHRLVGREVVGNVQNAVAPRIEQKRRKSGIRRTGIRERSSRESAVVEGCKLG
jgi:hypothetical protein